MKQHRYTRKKERGQSLVEAALILPVLIMIMLGLLDLGRAYYSLVVLNDAADEGASYAAIRPNDVAGIQARSASASALLVTIETDDVSVTYAPGGTVPGQPITVTVTVEMVIYTPFVGALVSGNSLDLTGRSVHIIRSN